MKTAREDLIVFCRFAEENKRRELESRGVVVVQVPMQRPPGDNTIVFPAGAPAVEGRPDLDRVMAELGKREITSLIIEGGAMVNWAALAAGIVDKIIFLLCAENFGRYGLDSVRTGRGLSPHKRSGFGGIADVAPFWRGFRRGGLSARPYKDEIRLVPSLENGT